MVEFAPAETVKIVLQLFKILFSDNSTMLSINAIRKIITFDKAIPRGEFFKVQTDASFRIKNIEKSFIRAAVRALAAISLKSFVIPQHAFKSRCFF